MNAIDQMALRCFDQLPDTGHVRLPVVKALFGVSRATIWRWSNSGTLPRPARIGGVTFWRVGELRAKLRERTEDAPNAN